MKIISNVERKCKIEIEKTSVLCLGNVEETDGILYFS